MIRYFVLALLLLAGCVSAQEMTDQAQEVAMAVADRDFIYICNQGEATVSVIDAAVNEVVTTVDLKELGYPANAKPHHIAVEPDGSYWYLSLIGANRVLKFDRTNEVVGMAEFEVPGMLQLSSDGMLYVGRSMSAVNPPQSIGMIERETMDIEELDVFFPRPHALAVTPDGDHVLSASLAENRMIVLDQETGDGEFFEFGGPIHSLVQFAVSPNGEMAIVGGELTGSLFILDLTGLPGIEVVTELEVGDRPWHPIFGPDGQQAYFGNKGANQITVVDVFEPGVVKTIEGEGLAQPHGTAISADGRWIYVTQQNTGAPMDMSPGADMSGHDHGEQRGMVVVVDTETNEIAKVLQVGVLPSGAGSRGMSR